MTQVVRSGVGSRVPQCAGFLLGVLIAVMLVGGAAPRASAAVGVWSGSGPGTISAVGSGTQADPAVFTYDLNLGNPGPGVSERQWTFSTEAASSGPVELRWKYSGHHAYFQVTVGLEAFVTPGEGSPTTVPLVSDGPVNCCTAPSAGFSYAGTTTLNVNAGDTYGFRLRGSNGDSNSRLQGRLEVPISPGNDAWTRAEPIALGESGNGSTTGSIDASGQARWYRFPIQPGTRASVDLTNVPANYDVSLFTDITQAYNTLTSPADLQRLSAEFAGDAPLALAPSALAPAVSPSVFSPSVFSPAVAPFEFSPFEFSPFEFSPFEFSPFEFSPFEFSPFEFSPSTFADGRAYESAQIRSVIAVSAKDGTASEHITADTWNNTGNFYVRVIGRNGSYSPSAPFNLNVHVAASSCTGVAPSTAPLLSAPVTTGLQALILADYGRMTGSLTTMQAKLATLAGAVGGKVVDLGAASPRVAALNAQADAESATGCPYAKNLVAEAIRDVVLAYRAANANLASVVVVGSDHVVPFFRYPDAADIGPESGYVPPVQDKTASQASLRLNYFLSQDAYGSEVDVQLRGFTVPVPDLPVGRLVETPEEIGGMIDAFLADSVVEPTSSLVTGYDFLTDAANSVQGTLSAGLGGTGADSLITNQDVDPSDTGIPPTKSWTADQLRSKLLGSRHDLVYLAGHFSANNTLAADYATTMNATELIGSNVNLVNAVVFSGGCHSGYNIVDGDAVPNVTQTLDWIQAFAQKRATLVAGTGYQYGDTDFLEYSERLYANFAEAFRFGTGPVSVGSALVSAKQRYLTDTPSVGGIHHKALLQATLYGLPMLGVNLPAGRNFSPPAGLPIVSSTVPVTTNPGQALGLSFADVSRAPALTADSRQLIDVNGAPSVTARWFSGPNGVVTNPGAPALPLEANDVSVAGKVLRGVGFRGGSYSDLTGVTPLTGAPVTELNGVHAPFVSSTFFPSRPWTVNYFGGLDDTPGASTKLLLTPVQYKTDAPGSQTNVQRKFSNVGLRLFYSAYTTTTPDGKSAALAGPPTIARVEADASGDTITFRVRAVGEPAAGMQSVWITYTAAGVTPGLWQSLDLTQVSTDTTLWQGTLSGVTPSQIAFVVQAVNGVGLVSFDDNRGDYYRPGQIAPALQAPGSLTGSALALSAPPSGSYGATVSLSATLTAGSTPLQGPPLQGQTVRFSLEGSEKTAVTGANGVATVDLPVLKTPGGYTIAAAFDGTATHASSAVSQAFAVTKAPTSLSLSSGSTSSTLGGETGVVATLTAGGIGIMDRSVTFVLTPTSGGAAVAVTRVTGLGGKARLGIVTRPGGQPLAPGSYTVAAYFGPNLAALGFAVPADPIYDGSATAGATVSLVVNRKIVFASTRTGNGDIYVADPGGGAPVQLTSGPAVDAEPEWSPGGDRIVFSSNRDGNLELYTMNADGSNVQRLTTNPAADTSAAWSPNGLKLAFASNRGPKENWDVYVMDANGANVQRLTTDSKDDLLPTWSPDGSQLAFTSTRSADGDIYTMSASGSNQVRRTTSSGMDTEPAWSASGIAFSTNRHGSSNFELYTMTSTGAAQTRRTDVPGHDVSPAWSADGERLVFATNRSPGGGGNYNLMTMAKDGKDQQPLVVHAAADVFPDW